MDHRARCMMKICGLLGGRLVWVEQGMCLRPKWRWVVRSMVRLLVDDILVKLPQLAISHIDDLWFAMCVFELITRCLWGFSRVKPCGCQVLACQVIAEVSELIFINKVVSLLIFWCWRTLLHRCFCFLFSHHVCGTQMECTTAHVHGLRVGTKQLLVASLQHPRTDSPVRAACSNTLVVRPGGCSMMFS